uniref:Clp ATPase C-terminal domain-containing protein n=1 Tax=Capitella teleta TaxID=283909 RepID=X1YZB2_CAPTE
FVNRIDEVVVFHPLGESQIKSIARIQLANLDRRLADNNLQLELSEEALDQLAEVGFDPVYGARPLKRAIQRSIENPLAEAILSGRFKPGDTINVVVNDGDLSFA